MVDWLVEPHIKIDVSDRMRERINRLIEIARAIKNEVSDGRREEGINWLVEFAAKGEMREGGREQSTGRCVLVEKRGEGLKEGRRSGNRFNGLVKIFMELHRYCTGGDGGGAHCVLALLRGIPLEQDIFVCGYSTLSGGFG